MLQEPLKLENLVEIAVFWQFFALQGATAYIDKGVIWHGKVYHGFTLARQFRGGV